MRAIPRFARRCAAVLTLCLSALVSGPVQAGDFPGDGPCLVALELAETQRYETRTPWTVRLGRIEEAWKLCGRSDVDPHFTARALLIYLSPDRLEKAASRRRLEGVLERLRGTANPGLEEANILLYLSYFAGNRGDSRERASYLEQMLASRRNHFGERSPEAARGMLLFASSLASETAPPADHQRAISLADQAHRMLAEERGESDPVAIRALIYASGVYRNTGRTDEAEAMEERASELTWRIGWMASRELPADWQ